VKLNVVKDDPEYDLVPSLAPGVHPLAGVTSGDIQGKVVRNEAPALNEFADIRLDVDFGGGLLQQARLDAFVERYNRWVPASDLGPDHAAQSEARLS
jgi:hypothetical protein